MIVALVDVVERIFARFAANPLVVRSETVWVVLCVNLRPFVRPAVLAAIILNVFDPVIVMLSPLKVILLYVKPLPAKVFAVAVALLTTIVDVSLFKVRPVVVVAVQTVPVPVNVQLPAPILSVLVDELEILTVVQVRPPDPIVKVPAEWANVVESVSVPIIEVPVLECVNDVAPVIIFPVASIFPEVIERALLKVNVPPVLNVPPLMVQLVEVNVFPLPDKVPAVIVSDELVTKLSCCV